MNQKIKIKKNRKNSFGIMLLLVFIQLGQINTVFADFLSAEEMISLTNQARVENGLPVFLINSKLTEAAEKKAADMFRFQYFDHNSPSGKTPWDFIKSTGYNYKYAGENLAIDFITAKGAHQALMESLSHRENILNLNYTEIGIVAVEGIFEGSKSIIIVEEFGAPFVKNEIFSDMEKEMELILEETIQKIEKKESDKIIKLETKQIKVEVKEKSKTIVKEEFFVEQDNNFDYEILANKFQQPEIAFFDCSLNEKNKNILMIKNKEELLIEKVNNEKVRGLFNVASAKEEYLRRNDYPKNIASLVEGNYFQKKFSENVFLLYIIIFIALVSNLVFTFYFYRKNILHSDSVI